MQGDGKTENDTRSKKPVSNNNNSDDTVQTRIRVDVQQPASASSQIATQLDGLAIERLDQLDDSIKACQGLIKTIHNGVDLAVPRQFLDPCAKIILLINDQDDTSAGYKPLLKAISDRIVQMFSWYSLFKGRELAPNQRMIVNATNLYPYYKKGAFTVDQLLSVSEHQRVNLFDLHVLGALQKGTLSFDDAMNLSFEQREQLAGPSLSPSISLTK